MVVPGRTFDADFGDTGDVLAQINQKDAGFRLHNFRGLECLDDADRGHARGS